uniref:ORF1a n=1 Tax=Wenling perciformes astrovirus 2 TaxID=2116153 RepID=A0A2P1GNE5_9VIRU|nr:ORF1a [Wenling perciformes astrovirus 2]
MDDRNILSILAPSPFSSVSHNIVTKTVYVVSEIRVTGPRVRVNPVAVRRPTGEVVFKNNIPLRKDRLGWSADRSTPVKTTAEEDRLLSITLCNIEGCNEVKKEVQRLKTENSKLKQENLHLRQKQNQFDQTKPTVDKVAMWKIIGCVLLGIWVLGNLPGGHAAKIINQDQAPEALMLHEWCKNKPIYCHVTTLCDGWCKDDTVVKRTTARMKQSYNKVMYGDWKLKDYLPKSPSSMYSARIVKSVHETADAFGDKVFGPAREHVVGSLQWIFSTDCMLMILTSLVAGRGFYVLQVLLHVYWFARAVQRDDQTVLKECGLLAIALCGGYGFLARFTVMSALSPWTMLVVLLASTGQTDCVVAAVVMQIIITVIIVSAGLYQTRTHVDSQGNERETTLSMRDWMLAVSGDIVCNLGVVACMQVPFAVILVGFGMWTIWYGLQSVETKEYSYDASGATVRVSRRKCRRATFPWVSHQAKKALGAVVTEKVYEAAFPIRSDDGNLGQSFLMGGKLCILHHVTHGKGFSVNCAGQWLKNTGKLLKTVDLGLGQSLLCYAPMKEMAGKSNCKWTNKNENGWNMVGYINPEDSRREVVIYYGHWKAPQYVGTYEHQPGMSGAPVFNSAGRVCAVHYGAAGMEGLALAIPLIVDDVKEKNPDAKPITALQNAYANSTDDLVKTAELKRLLGFASKKQCPTEYHDAMREYGDWSFIPEKESVQEQDVKEQRKSGHLNDHDEPASKRWVTVQMQNMHQRFEEMFYDMCHEREEHPHDYDDVVEQKKKQKSLMKSKGMRKVATKLRNRGGLVNRTDLRRAGLGGVNFGRQFAEEEYDDYQAKGLDAGALRMMALERWLEKNGSVADSEESDESQTYAAHNYAEQGLFFSEANDNKMNDLENKVAELEERCRQLAEEAQISKKKVSTSLRRIKKKLPRDVDETDFQEIEQALKMNVTRWNFTPEGPHCSVERHEVPSCTIKEVLEDKHLKASPYCVTSMEECDSEGETTTSALLNGVEARMVCDGCLYCRVQTADYVPQATKKPPVRTKCGDTTTCYTGHLRFCKKGCTENDVPEQKGPCKKHCRHWHCHMTNAENGKLCLRPDCNNPFNTEKKKIEKQQETDQTKPTRTVGFEVPEGKQDF